MRAIGNRPLVTRFKTGTESRLAHDPEKRTDRSNKYRLSRPYYVISTSFDIGIDIGKKRGEGGGKKENADGIKSSLRFFFSIPVENSLRRRRAMRSWRIALFKNSWMEAKFGKRRRGEKREDPASASSGSRNYTTRRRGRRVGRENQ